MRHFLLTVALLLVLGGQCWAVTPVNLNMINEAQKYGQARAQLTADEFLRPWQAYEETAAKLDKSAERAYLYTPYLLLAADAKQKALEGKIITVPDSEQVLGNYAGYVVFSAELFGEKKGFVHNTRAFLLQGEKQIPVQELIMSPAAKTEWYPKRPRYQALCYMYFEEKEVNLHVPVQLVIKTGRLKHKFHFDLPQIK